MYHFSILYSASLDRYYTGYTSCSIAERIRRHNSNHAGYTGRASDWLLVYSEQFDSKTNAKSRESEVKDWKSRKKIEELIGRG